MGPAGRRGQLRGWKLSTEHALIGSAWLAITLLSFVVAALVRQVAMLQGNSATRKSGSTPLGPGAGSSLPADLARLAAPGSGLRGILVFVTSGCPTCSWVEMALKAGHLKDTIVVTKGEASTALGLNAAATTRLFQDLGVRATPYALALEPNGAIIRAGVVSDFQAFTETVALEGAD